MTGGSIEVVGGGIWSVESPEVGVPRRRRWWSPSARRLLGVALAFRSEYGLLMDLVGTGHGVDDCV